MATSGHLLILPIVGMLLSSIGTTVAAATIRLSRAADTFFMEDNQVYTRLLWLEAAGTYRQVVNGFGLAREVVRGTWEQAAGGEVVLHPTNGALTLRAISAGALCLPLGVQSQIDAAAGLPRAIAALLGGFHDTVFARDVLGDLESQSGARIVLRAGAASFERTDLVELSRRLGIWLQSRASGTAVFDLVDEKPAPVLLIQREAVFTKDLLASVRREYKVARNAAPPFYFARTDEKTWRTRADRWVPFDHLGGSQLVPPPGSNAR